MEKATLYYKDNFYNPDHFTNPPGTWFSKDEFIKAFHYLGKSGAEMVMGAGSMIVFYSKMNDTQRNDLLKKALDGKDPKTVKAVQKGGYIMDRNLGMPQAEANAKWGTNFYTEPKGVIGKVAGGIVAGFVAGGPIGAIAGGIGAGIQHDAQVKAAMNESKQAATKVQQQVASIKEQLKTQTSTQAINPNVSTGGGLQAMFPDIKPINILGKEINPLYLGIGALLLLFVFFIFYNPNK